MDKSCDILDLGSYQLKFGGSEEIKPSTRRRSQLGQKISYNSQSQMVIGGLLNQEDKTLHLCPNEDQQFDVREYNVFPLLDDGYLNNHGVRQISNILQYSSSLIVVDNLSAQVRNRTREKITILFESLDLENLLIINSQAVQLFSKGITTGAVLDAGEHQTKFIPIYEGTSITDGSVIIDYGGYSCVKQLQEAGSLGVVLNTAKEEEIFRHLLYKPKNYKYQLPDGQEISIGEAGEKVTETFVQNTIDPQSKYLEGIEPQLQQQMKQNLLLSGGVWKQPNSSYLFKLALRADIKVIEDQDDVQLNSWFGAKVFSQIALQEKRFMTKQQYDDYGLNSCVARFFI